MDNDRRNNRLVQGLSRRDFLFAAGATALVACAPTGPRLRGLRRHRHEARKSWSLVPWRSCNLNPILRQTSPGSIVIYNIFDNLALPNYKTREMSPELAESWKNVDPTTWEIKLREGVLWHKGYGEVTAADLAYTWNPPP